MPLLDAACPAAVPVGCVAADSCVLPVCCPCAPHQVELWTQPQHRVYTSVKKGSRNPTWRNQKHELLVQEPDSQMLRIVLNDIDMLNVKVSQRTRIIRQWLW